MAFDPIPERLERLWDSWNLRGVILLSLSLQAFLILFAPFRKKTGNVLMTFLVWAAYLLADWAAAFAVGLISSSHDDAGDPHTRDLLAFWAPFLLSHLGGPDTITAFAIEDNALWFRHLVGLVFQTAAAAYVFLLTLPQNDLRIPTTLIFIAGLIKYGERTRALYLASIDKLMEYRLGVPDPGPDYKKFMDEYNSRVEARVPIRVAVHTDRRRSDFYSRINTDEEDSSALEQSDVVNAYNFFNIFKGLVADTIFSYNDREESREFFQSRRSEEALKVISAELNFFYEMLFTKSEVVHSAWGHIRRLICFLTVVAALALFIQVKNVHEFQRFDVIVTYTLLIGAVALDTVALFMLVLSDWTVAEIKNSLRRSKVAAKLDRLLGPTLKLFLSRKNPKWRECETGRGIKYRVLDTPIMFRRWSESISAHNLLELCLKECPVSISKPKGRCSLIIGKILYFPHLIFGIVANYVGMMGQKFASRCRTCVKVGSVSKRSGISSEYVSGKLRRIFGSICHFFEKLFERLLDKLGLKEIIVRIRYVSKNPFMMDLWDFLYKELKEKSSRARDPQTAKRICEGRGDLVLKSIRESHAAMLMPYIEEVDYDQSILLWHIATELCYNTDDEGSFQTRNDDREFSKILSDYMLYLLVMQGNMMAGVAGIGQIRYQDTCAEAEEYFGKINLEKTKKLMDACRSHS